MLTGGTGGGEGKRGGDTSNHKANKKRERDKRQITVFKYIKMDTVGSYIHIHLTKPGEEGRKRAV